MSALLDSPSPLVAEAHRRRLLSDSDVLLDLVERLRLNGQRACPPALSEAVRALQVSLGRVNPTRPRSARTAHQLLLSLQARLMAANPRNPTPSPQAGRPRGQPARASLRRGGKWKFLALPRPPAAPGPGEVAEWYNLVRATVHRALDRWMVAQDRAVRAARGGRGALAALERAGAAWRNYWELSCEADLLLNPQPPPGADRIGRDAARGDR